MNRAGLKFFRAGGSAIAFASTLFGAEPVATKPTDDELRIRGVFDSALPGTERKNSLRLIVHPHFGDLHQRDYLRMPLGLRYGVNERWEVTGEVEAFFAHGIGKVPFFAREGFSNVHAGTKYQLGEALLKGWETAVGIDWTRPVGSPPLDLTDGLQHVAAFTSFSHRLERNRDWRVFWSVGYDDVTATSVPGQIRRNDLGDDAVSMSGGVLHERGPATYTLEATWASTRVVGRLNQDVFTVRPGVVWVLPARYTFGSKGRWLLGGGLRLSRGPDGFDAGVNAKLRVNFDFKRLFRSKPPATGP